ncbi:hypothetical protein KY084_02310 [Stakelama sp. CBK3Z-3]|uniref:DUF2178 domain-containing protein n=1 Tax=Stakelama flava TaxID=2860338 RepID=A0ABS6XHM4_9SPHN|nr:hypothetical protein [Stakelama flava]MBW4329708.1 hypothetical protein [Stakelama flava]
MNDRRHRFLLWLDRSVEWTGIPSLAEGTPRRRHLRWLPLLALLLASIGLTWCAMHSGRDYWIGYSLIMAGFFIANLMPIWGPLRRLNERADEYERKQRRDSFMVGLATTTAAGFAGIWLTVGLLAMQIWSASAAQQELMALGFYMMALFSAVPTLYASWRTRPITEEE